MVLLITDSFLRLQKVSLADYFLPQLSALNSAKIHDFEILWSEDLPIADAVYPIYEKIQLAPTPVTLIAHGKGGLDALECLLQNPQLHAKIEKFVLMQTPAWGTPIADFLTGHPLMRFVTKFLCRSMGCSLAAIEEMSELNRQVYMIVNKEKIRALMENVPVVTVGTSFEMPFTAENGFQRIMRRIQALVTKHAGANDGLVPLVSTRISTEPHVQLENVTHLSLVTPNMSIGAEVEDVTRNILKPAKPEGPAEYPSKFPWALSEENSDAKPAHPFQLEIS